MADVMRLRPSLRTASVCIATFSGRERLSLHFFPPAKESYLPGGRPRAISADKLHKFLKRVLSRVVVVSDGWVGKVRARLLDDGG